MLTTRTYQTLTSQPQEDSSSPRPPPGVRHRLHAMAAAARGPAGEGAVAPAAVHMYSATEKAAYFAPGAVAAAVGKGGAVRNPRLR